MPTDMALQFVQLFGPFGFIMYIVWRFQNHTIPRLAEDNRLAQAQQRADFKELLKEQRDFFRENLKREQEIHSRQIQEMVGAIKELASKIK